MTTYLIIAHDAEDEGRIARREATRPAHFDRVRPFVESGQILAGGGMLDDEGETIGSAFFATFETQEDLQEWLEADPYYVNRVWGRFEIIPMNIVVEGDGDLKPFKSPKG